MPHLKKTENAKSSTVVWVWKTTNTYTVMSHHQNAGQYCNIHNNVSLKNVAWLKYFGIMVKKNCIHEDIINKLYLGNVC
jgi:hypothetical protein